MTIYCEGASNSTRAGGRQHCRRNRARIPCGRRLGKGCPCSAELNIYTSAANENKKDQVSFFKHPFKHVRQLLEKKIRKLETTSEQLEQHVKEQYSDQERNVPLAIPGYIPRPAPPTAEFSNMSLKFSEVRQVVRKARSSSAQGPN